MDHMVLCTSDGSYGLRDEKKSIKGFGVWGLGVKFGSGRLGNYMSPGLNL